MLLPLNRADNSAAQAWHPFDGGGRATTALRPTRSGSSHTPVLILIIALAVTATILSYRVFLCRVDDGLRKAVVKELQELFPAASIYVGRVTAEGPGGLVVNDVRFAMKGALPKREVLLAERVVLRGDLDVAHYLQQSVRVEQVDLFGLQIHAWPTGGESWSVACLTPHPNPNASPPIITMANALVHLHSDATPGARSIAIHDIQGRVEPSATGAARATGAASATGRHRAGSTPGPIRGHLTGRSSGLVRAVEVHVELDPNRETMHASGSIEELDFSPGLLKQLPPELARYLTQLSGLQCRASSTFEIAVSSSGTPTFRLQGNLVDGRLQDARLPYPLENLSSDFFCNNSLLQLRSMRAHNGSTQLTLHTDISGFSLDSPMVVHAEAKHLELDKRLYQSLPPSAQAQWDHLQLAGRVSGNIKLAFDGRSWSPSADIDCHDVSITPWLFPYAVTAIRGRVSFQDSSIRSEHLSGRAGGQTLHAAFDLSHAAEQWFGSLHCKAEGPISIDEPLISALTPVGKQSTAVEKFIRSVHPSGAVHLVNASFERASAEELQWHRTINANVYGGMINYDGFSYPIRDIRGRVVGQDDNWWLDRFEGRNDSGRILCSGHWLNVKEGQVPFRLQFNAYDVPAQEDLQAALPSDAQFIWDELQPSGTIDSVTATIVRPTSDSQVDIRVELLEDSSTNKVTGRSLSLMPKSFPYRLYDVGCNITYEPGFVSIVSASATNGPSRFSLTGECRPSESGRWQADVRWLPTTRVMVDSQLLAALPRSVRDSLVKLDFSGPVSIFGESQLLFANTQHPELVTAWKCQLDVEDGRLADGKNIGALRGTVWVEGHSDGAQLSASGTLGMDALTVRGIPITNLEGPFALLGSELYFGTTVSDVLPRVGQPASPPITAEALAGKLTLSGHSRLDVGKLYLDAQLKDAELTTLLQDVGVDRAGTQAMCNATLQFSGIPWNPQTHVGRGRVQLSDAKLYQLPFMIRLLSVTSVSAGDDSAFQTADINFQIDGDRIPLQIACDGEVLRLRGEGWTNLRREINLELFSYVGRRIPISTVISPLLAESRYATLMMIEVEGTLDNPIMQRRPFPQFEATLQQLFPDVADRRSIGDALPWRR